MTSKNQKFLIFFIFALILLFLEAAINPYSSQDDIFGTFFISSAVLIFLLFIFPKILPGSSKKIIVNRSAKNECVTKPKTISQPAMNGSPIPLPEKPPEVRDIVIRSAVQYKGTNILYKIKIENNSQEPVGDIKVGLFVPDVFRLEERDKLLSMLQPGEGKTVTFEIEPTGECGNCVISGSIRYYDYSKKKHLQINLANRMVDIICPILKAKEIDENSWRQQTSTMLIAEEDTKDLDVPAENLFSIATRVLKDINFYMISPEVTSNEQLFTGVACFYAEGVAGLKYASYVEIVGKRRSRMIIKAWAEKEEALTGLYHKIHEEIEKRIDIKTFVDDSITHYNINATTIKDSVIQRSNIGDGKDKCFNCGYGTKAGDRFCPSCGERL